MRELLKYKRRFYFILIVTHRASKRIRQQQLKNVVLRLCW